MRCKECGVEVPARREFCLNCGAPTNPGLRERQRQLSEGRGQRPELEPKSNRKGVFIAAAAALLGLSVVGSNWFDPDFDVDFDSDDDIEVVVRDEPRGAVTIEADDLYKAYRDNPDAAEERFDDREMVVSGEFQRIVPDGYGSLDLRLATSNPQVPIGVDLADLAVEDGKALRPGQRITVSCQGMGSGDDTLWVRDCAIQPNAESGAVAEASGRGPEDASVPAAPADADSSE